MQSLLKVHDKCPQQQAGFPVVKGSSASATWLASKKGVVCTNTFDAMMAIIASVPHVGLFLLSKNSKGSSSVARCLVSMWL